MKSLIECPNCHKMLTAKLAACPRCGWLVAAQEPEPESAPEPMSAPEPVPEEAAAPADAPASPNTVGEYHIERAEESVPARISGASPSVSVNETITDPASPVRSGKLLRIAIWAARAVSIALVFLVLGSAAVNEGFGLLTLLILIVSVILLISTFVLKKVLKL